MLRRCAAESVRGELWLQCHNSDTGETLDRKRDRDTMATVTNGLKAHSRFVSHWRARQNASLRCHEATASQMPPISGEVVRFCANASLRHLYRIIMVSRDLTSSRRAPQVNRRAGAQNMPEIVGSRHQRTRRNSSVLMRGLRAEAEGRIRRASLPFRSVSRLTLVSTCTRFWFSRPSL